MATEITTSKKIRCYRLTDESQALLQDALEQAEASANDRSLESGDEDDQLAIVYSRLQRVLLHQQSKTALIDDSEDSPYLRNLERGKESNSK